MPETFVRESECERCSMRNSEALKAIKDDNKAANDAVWKKLNAIDNRVWLLLLGMFSTLVAVVLK